MGKVALIILPRKSKEGILYLLSHPYIYLNSSECKCGITTEYRILNGPNLWGEFLNICVQKLIIVHDICVDNISTVAAQIVE